MKMRRWQAECIAQALKKYDAGQSHFLCLATPGAGKTLMAATLASKLLESRKIDLVICFAPSTIVAEDFRIELETRTRCRMDGLLGSKGCSLTYQSMLNLPESFWTLLKQQRVLVIFDEIHHCAGHTLEHANAWGQKIIQNIQGKATYTMALTGTPWRSDKVPIALSRYSHQGQIQRDYQYGLARAVADKVCRPPRIIAIDNDRITVTGPKEERYTSFQALLQASICSYQDLLENDRLIVYLLRQSSQKLKLIRRGQANAGGLIVAASVEHAHKIQSLLSSQLGEQAQIATYVQEDAHRTINDFRNSRDKWIISVGMISEGTNIPRLRVCCHLTRVKTELHFRQVLGRILRADADDQEESFLYMPAEPSLVEYAHRVADDLPGVETVSLELMNATDNLDAPATPHTTQTHANDVLIDLGDSSPRDPLDISPIHGGDNYSDLADAYDATVNIFGRFRQEVLLLPFS